MDMFDFAGLLFGGNRNRTEATTVTATGAAASDGGVAGVTLDADVTPADDVGEDADQTIIDLPTSPDVDEGDELIVTLVGDGPLKTPVVTANPGSGDRMRALANSAKTVADAAQAVADAINQHFWHDTNGAHVTEATQDEWEQSHSGPNSLWNSLGMLFRNGLNNLLTLTTENGARALTIWDGLGNSASNILARFSSDGISFADGTSFDIGDSSSYIHFDGNGHINIGGSGLTIGGYATNTDVTNAIDGISVGGRNLLTGTGDWSGGVISSGAGTVSGDVFSFEAHDTLAWYSIAISYPHIPFPSVDGKTLTLGFDYRSDDFSDTTGDHYIYINAAASATIDGGRSKYRQISTNAFNGVYVPTTEWQRGSITFDLSESLFNAGSGECNYFFIQFYNHTLNSYQLRHVKLEVGNVATDWSQAQEDLEAYADESAYLSAKPNIAPLGSVEFSDVYNATTNPNGYWRATIGAWYTRLDDGWIHVYVDNSAGTGAVNSTSFRPSPSPTVVAGKVYTILTEIRNNVSTGTSGSIVDFYLQQINNNQFWGNTSGVVIDDDHVTTTTTVSLLTCGQSYVLRSYRIADTDHLTAGTPSPEMFRYNFRAARGSVLNFDFRMSVYEGIYDGPYKPYSGTQLFATQTDASNAAKTATSYVTEITGQNGIMVHPSTDDDTGVRITSDVDIRQDNVSIANFGALDSSSNPTARLGKADGYHVSIDTDSLDVIDATTTLASFGSEVLIGPTNDNHIEIGTMTNGSKGLALCNQDAYELEFTPREFFSPWSSTPFMFLMQGGNQSLDFANSGVEIWALGDPVESNYAKAVLKLNARIGTANQVGSFTFQTNAGSNTWSTPPGTVLWSGGWYMMASQTANLAYNVSTCHSGIVLHFQPYTSGTAQNYFHQYCFVPKTTVTAGAGAVHNFTLCNSGFAKVGMKALRIYDNRIVGDDTNDDTGTASGITFDNKYWVLTQVIAV